MTSEPISGSGPEIPPEYPHWNRVYIGVILFTILVICGLWIFSRAFTPSP